MPPQRYLDRHPAPGNPRQLAGHEIIGFHESLAGVPGAKWIETHGVGATIVLHLAEMTEMQAAALSGAGLALVPCILAESELRLLRLTEKLSEASPCRSSIAGKSGLSDRCARCHPFRRIPLKDNAALISGEAE